MRSGGSSRKFCLGWKARAAHPGRWLPLFVCAACGSDPRSGLWASETARGNEGTNLGRYGLVAISSQAPGAEHGADVDADAFFWRASGRGDDGCQVVDNFERCEVTECAPVAAAAASLEEFAWLSAGAVDVLGTKLAFGFREAGAGGYTDTLPTRELPLWDGGERLTVVAGGSEQFPAVEASLVAPSHVILSAPELAGLSVNPLTGLRLAWSSPRRESIFVTIEERRAVPYPASKDVSVRCAFPAEAGTGFVPAAAFRALSDPDLLHGYRFWITTESEAESSLDGATLTFVAWSESARFDAGISHELGRADQRTPISTAVSAERF